jgi:glycosyltransferase involved in cell wall biosynthesis
MSAPIRVLVLEPYYGGSHRAVLDGLVERLSTATPPAVAGDNASPTFTFDLLRLPARKWKWRMRGSAIVMADRACELARGHRAAGGEGSRWDLIYASTFVNLAEFRSLAGEALLRADGRAIPAIVYFHENQLVYPNRFEAEWDLQVPLTNVVSALTADLCLFNSRFTLDSFLAEIPAFFKRFPDHLPKGVVPRIEAKSSVLAPPFDPAPFDGQRAVRGAVPRIVWPHRWEHDKNPDEFFRVCAALAAEGLDFEVAVAGQAFADTPDVFGGAAELLGKRLVHLGTPDDAGGYAELLASSDIAVSTAMNEFFGLAMIEAACAGCYPLVPDRLAYRELYPERFRYPDEAGLAVRLRELLVERPLPGAAREIAEAFTYDRLTWEYARTFAELAVR